MRSLPLFAALAALAAAAPAIAAPASTPKETAGDFQVYVLGDMNMSGNNFQRMAVGGNATFSSTTVGGATAANPSSLVVGKDLTYNNGGTISGPALVGGASHTPAYMTSVSAGQATLPVDFTAENLRLKNLSTTLAATPATGASFVQWGGLNLTGANSDLNVFTINASDLSSVSWFNANIASGSQVLINVLGTTVNLTGGLSFYNASNILWNFSQATSITAGGVSLGGTVLAPFATFQGNGGSINGDLIVGNFNGAISVYGSGYAGNLLTPPPAAITPPAGITLPTITPVPEPGVWALMILGFGAVGAVLRRRRGLGALATRA